jgi:hypothetical protein
MPPSSFKSSHAATGRCRRHRRARWSSTVRPSRGPRGSADARWDEASSSGVLLRSGRWTSSARSAKEQLHGEGNARSTTTGKISGQRGRPVACSHEMATTPHPKTRLLAAFVPQADRLAGQRKARCLNRACSLPRIRRSQGLRWHGARRPFELKRPSGARAVEDVAGGSEVPSRLLFEAVRR